MNRPSPHGGVVGAGAGLLPPLLHKSSVLPASRHSFPARPGFRAGRKKIPFAATSRFSPSGSDAHSLQRQRREEESALEVNVDTPQTTEMALDKTEPDAAMELVRNWEKSLQVMMNCLPLNCSLVFRCEEASLYGRVQVRS